MAAWRCPKCLTNWPMLGDYKVCPACQERCSGMTGAKPIEVGEAQSRVAHILFEREYEKYDANRAGSSPEEIGAAEARELARKWRELEASLGEG